MNYTSTRISLTAVRWRKKWTILHHFSIAMVNYQRVIISQDQQFGVDRWCSDLKVLRSRGFRLIMNLGNTWFWMPWFLFLLNLGVVVYKPNHNEDTMGCIHQQYQLASHHVLPYPWNDGIFNDNGKSDRQILGLHPVPPVNPRRGKKRTNRGWVNVFLAPGPAILMYGDFHKWGYPQSSSILLDFPL